MYKVKNSKIKNIGIGMLGCGLIGKAHSNGFLQMPYIFWPPPAIPKLVSLCDKNESYTANEALRFGYSNYCTDWQDLINDSEIEIFVNTSPNFLHAEPCIEAAKVGKNIVCEKPLARSSEEAKKMLDAVNKSGVKHICNFNYRTIPALTLVKKLITDGKLGRILNFRANFLVDGLLDPMAPLTWRQKKECAGSGVLGDVSAHTIDLARWLVGEINFVMASNKTFIKERYISNDKKNKGKVETDDTTISILEFENRAIGYVEASGVCSGRKFFLKIEINGEKGSIYWDFEHFNSLYFYANTSKNKNIKGFQKIDIVEKNYPYYDRWFEFCVTSGINYINTFVHTAYNIVNAVINGAELSPMIATFDDGYKVAVICDSILKSAETGRKIEIKY